MNRNLLPQISGLFTVFKTQSHTLLLTLVLLLNFGITSKINAQCIGPYQKFESFKPITNLSTDGWTFNTTLPVPAIGTTGAQARSGSNSLILRANNNYIQTPLLATPKDFSFYYRNNVTASDITLIVEYSSTLAFSTPTTLSTLVTRSNVYTNYTVDLSALSNVYVRISFVSSVVIATGSPGTGANSILLIDDISWTSTNSSQNTVVVPELGKHIFDCAYGLNSNKQLKLNEESVSN